VFKIHMICSLTCLGDDELVWGNLIDMGLGTNA